MGLVVSNGIGAAVRVYLDRQGMTIKTFARKLDVPTSTMHGIMKRDANAPEATFDRILTLVPEPWTKPHCALSDRPAGGWPKPKRPPKKYEPDGNSFQRIPTPNLDSSNGIEGAWL